MGRNVNGRHDGNRQDSKRIVWKYGLAAAAVLVAMMAVSLPLTMNRVIDFSVSELVGYTSMVLSFLVVFFGVRVYREEVCDGVITFRRAFGVGLSMTLIVCAVYVACWQVVYWGFWPDFMDQFSVLQIERMRAEGATEEAIAAARAQMARFAELYRNPLFNVAMTFLEVFPVGLVTTLVAAGILRRRSPAAAAAAVAA